MKKKVLSLLLACFMTMSLTACGGDKAADTTGGQNSGGNAAPVVTANPSEIVDGKFVETRKITVEVYDRGNDGGSDPINNMYTDYIKKGMLEDHNVEVEFVAVSTTTLPPLLPDSVAPESSEIASVAFSLDGA